MKIITAYFDYFGVDKYARCLRALTNSIKNTNPDADFQVLRLTPPAAVDGIFQGWLNNHIKLKAYSQQPILENTIFVDADTVFLRNAEDLFNNEFDIAIARRPGVQKSIYNGGVVLFKPTGTARAFMDSWINIDQQMLDDPLFHNLWHKKYRGMNQSSLGYLVENFIDVKIKEYPTGVINACEQDWQHIIKTKPYILHVRKRLLEIALSDIPINKLSFRHKDAVRIWREFETQ